MTSLFGKSALSAGWGSTLDSVDCGYHVHCGKMYIFFVSADYMILFKFLDKPFTVY